MLHPDRELLFLIMQFLDEKNLTETMHQLQQESGLYFNMKYFEEQVLNGNWDSVEKYLCGFMKVDDNAHSKMTFFEIRKLKYLEALDKVDKTEAVEILMKDLKVFASSNKKLFEELTQLLTLENFRKHELLCEIKDTASERAKLFGNLKILIKENPLLKDKLPFPILPKEALRNLMLNLRHGQEPGLYFNMKYFEEEILNGNWSKAEKYLCGFTKVDDNVYSQKMFYGIRKRKFLEAFFKADTTEALEILNDDLKVFTSSRADSFKKLTQLILKKFRQPEVLCTYYEDTISERANLFLQLKRLIKENPLLRDKLQLRTPEGETLCELMLNQSASRQQSRTAGQTRR